MITLYLLARKGQDYYQIHIANFAVLEDIVSALEVGLTCPDRGQKCRPAQFSF